MAAGSTYTPIATTTLGSAQASVTFSSISGSYTDLVLVWRGTGTLAGLNIEFNSDSTASNYSFTRIYGDGSSATSDRATSAQNWNGINTAQSMGIYHIQNYSNTTTYKTTLTKNQYQSVVLAIVGLWRSTNAINQVKLTIGSGLIDSGSTFTLYGITAA